MKEENEEISNFIQLSKWKWVKLYSALMLALHKISLTFKCRGNFFMPRNNLAAIIVWFYFRYIKIHYTPDENSVWYYRLFCGFLWYNLSTVVFGYLPHCHKSVLTGYCGTIIIEYYACFSCWSSSHHLVKT